MMNSLGFDKAPQDTRVVVAMSGGVDSSVVAALLHEQGYDVIGVTLQLYDYGEAVRKKGACCAGQDIHDARRVAESLAIPHYVLNYEDRFKESVIDDFVDSYTKGYTPVPCVKCNQTVKFKDLLATAQDLGADCMATGHYVRREDVGGKGQMLRGVDDTKDQSYFLFATTQDQLDFLRFPLGGQIKDETRELAKKYGLLVQDKPDSQDICFVPQGNYAEVVAKFRPGALDAGEIVHVDGRVLGEHKGIIHYTIGQRRGLRIAAPDPLYVIKLDAENKKVIVGPKEALAETHIKLQEFNWLGEKPVNDDGMDVEVKIRSTRPAVPATLYSMANGQGAKLTLHGAEYGVAPGQAGVIYDGERVLGGGWIAL